MLRCLSSLSRLQSPAGLGLFDFLGLFARVSFVSILQSGSAVLSAKDHRTDDRLTRPELCLCRLGKDAPSMDDQCHAQAACLTLWLSDFLIGPDTQENQNDIRN